MLVQHKDPELLKNPYWKLRDNIQYRVVGITAQLEFSSYDLGRPNEAHTSAYRLGEMVIPNRLDRYTVTESIGLARTGIDFMCNNESYARMVAIGASAPMVPRLHTDHGHQHYNAIPSHAHVWF